MATTSPGIAVPDARAAYFAWRGYVRKRDSTDLGVLDHPLLREAWAAAWRHGTRNSMALMTEFAGAIDINRRVADLLEQLVYEREALGMVGAEEADAESGQ